MAICSAPCSASACPARIRVGRGLSFVFPRIKPVLSGMDVRLYTSMSRCSWSVSAAVIRITSSIK